MTFKNPNQINNLPPGCKTSDLPGFRDRDKYIDVVENIMEYEDCSFNEAEEILESEQRNAAADRYDELKEKGLL